MTKVDKPSNNIHKYILFFVAFILLVFSVIAIRYLTHTSIPLLSPKGPIALKEYHLLMFSLLLSLVVVIPVFIIAIIFVYKYRESNKTSKYSPDLDRNPIIETLWWLVPSALILVLAIVTWNSSHTLDPYKLIQSNVKPITIQVIAMDWKWLFIYPEHNMATLNYFAIPVNTPVNFQITSDAPMNSFWIPQLGSQIYAMPGMSTQLNLLASSVGRYYGSSANISGKGFSGMNFYAYALSSDNFQTWTNSIKKSPDVLDLNTYNKLAVPSTNNQIINYAYAQYGLYNTVVNRFLTPPNGVNGLPVNNDSQPINAIQPNINNMQGMGM